MPRTRLIFTESYLLYQLIKLINFTQTNNPEILERIHEKTHAYFGFNFNVTRIYFSTYTYECTVPNCFKCLIFYPSLSTKELRPDAPLISSFHTFLTSHSYLPTLFCITYKSSLSCWYHASVPHPYITLLTIIVFHLSNSVFTSFHLHSSTSSILQSPNFYLCVLAKTTLYSTFLHFIHYSFHVFFTARHLIHNFCIYDPCLTVRSMLFGLDFFYCSINI